MEAVPAPGRLRTRVALAAALGAVVSFAVPAAAGPVAQQPPPGPPPAAPLAAPQPVTGFPAPRYPSPPSRALGTPTHGRLVRGVQLPVEGQDYLTWDNVYKRVPNRGWRRWGTDRLIRFLLAVLRDYRTANPDAPRVLVGDLSLEHGGPFGANFGGLGHFSHQNGLDADVYYPRRDRRPLEPTRVSQIDHRLAADLLERFIRAGAVTIYVGPHTGLRGPRRIVRPLVHHDNHMHVRIR